MHKILMGALLVYCIAVGVLVYLAVGVLVYLNVIKPHLDWQHYMQHHKCEAHVYRDVNNELKRGWICNNGKFYWSPQ